MDKASQSHPSGVGSQASRTGHEALCPGGVVAPGSSPPSTCIEHQGGRPTLRLSFQIKVF